MTIEKKMIRSDIPGSHVFMHGNVSYAGTPAEELRRLVVTREISLSGNISACDHLVIEGGVEAPAFAARRLEILDGGRFSGSAEVQDCVIAGRFDGTLTVHGRLTLKPTGQLCGDVRFGALEVEAGAHIDAHLLNIPAPVVTAPAPVVTKAVPPAPAAPVVSNVEPLFAADSDEGANEKVIAGRAVYRRAARG